VYSYHVHYSYAAVLIYNYPCSHVQLSCTPGIDIHVSQYRTFIHEILCRVGIFKSSMWARNRKGIGLSYRPARLQRLAELTPWNRFLASIKVEKFGLSSPRTAVKLYSYPSTHVQLSLFSSTEVSLFSCTVMCSSSHAPVQLSHYSILMLLYSHRSTFFTALL
jgi:hypothetical protein